MRRSRKPLLIAIVEGFGDEASIPILLRRWFQLCGVDWSVRAVRAGKVDENALEDLIENDVLANDPTAILVLRDNDGDCHRYKGTGGLGPTLKRIAEKIAGDVKVGVVIADYCYEAWLIACWEELKAGKMIKKPPHANMRTGEIFTINCHSLKSEIEYVMDIRGKRHYDERNDQPALSKLLPLDPSTQGGAIKELILRASSYGKLIRVLEELTNCHPVSTSGSSS